MTFARYPSLQGKSAIVTGGASGIGEATVRAFSEQGARVGFVDMDAERGAALAAELGAAGHAVQFARCDLREVGELNVAFASLAKAHGPARVLVNNAARDDRHRWQEVDAAYWDERVATNLRHMFFAIQAVAPGMIAAGGGSIINLGSDSWHRAIGGLPVYATCKAAVHGLTRSFARELGPHRIRVNTVVPGWTMTERQKRLWVTEEGLAGHKAQQCLPDMVQPEDVARMVLFLASDDAPSCTAHNFMVDAGVI
ncbi:MAG TPA: SDR family oxidoreductase [Polyangiaceae bacterium]|nr:SDR family oxidoreductase [Polyangiaceae bacterium]